MSIDVSNIAMDFVQLRLIAVGTQVTVALGPPGPLPIPASTGGSAPAVSDVPTVGPSQSAVLDEFA